MSFDEYMHRMLWLRDNDVAAYDAHREAVGIGW